MNDVAAAAGVGLKTVSRVVNDEPGVAPATALRVREAIAALGFRRNESARLLRQGRTATIGLLLEDIADPFFSVLSRAVEEVARRNGSLLFTGSSGADPERERELALAFCARRVDGLLVVPTGTDHRYLLPELAAGTPTVFVDRPARQLTGDAVLTDTVLTDNVGGARAGTAHLARHGHRRIAFLGDLPQLHTSAERLRGTARRWPRPGCRRTRSWWRSAAPNRSRSLTRCTGWSAGPTRPPRCSPATTGSPSAYCARCPDCGSRWRWSASTTWSWPTCSAPG